MRFDVESLLLCPGVVAHGLVETGSSSRRRKPRSRKCLVPLLHAGSSVGLFLCAALLSLECTANRTAIWLDLLAPHSL